MKLLLTPEGVRDPVIDMILETNIIKHLIPDKPIITVLLCNDGKDISPSIHAPLDLPLYRNSFWRLCSKVNARRNGKIQEVQVRQISFWHDEDLFQSELAICDIFFMAGFTNKCDHIEAVYRDIGFQLKRHAVANRCILNQMTCWGVCGSAISFGCLWDVTWSSRHMGSSCEMFQMLGQDGWVNYTATTTPNKVVVTTDLREWQMTSGTGLGVCITEDVRFAEAFLCVKSKTNKRAWKQLAGMMAGKLAEQVALLSQKRTVYNASRHGLRLWCLSWYGHWNWIGDEDLEVTRDGDAA